MDVAAALVQAALAAVAATVSAVPSSQLARKQMCCSDLDGSQQIGCCSRLPQLLPLAILGEASCLDCELHAAQEKRRSCGQVAAAAAAAAAGFFRSKKDG